MRSIEGEFQQNSSFRIEVTAEKLNFPFCITSHCEVDTRLRQYFFYFIKCY